MQTTSEEKQPMAMLTVRNLPDEVHRTLRLRAAQHGHSMEAEVRQILAAATSPEGRVRLGSLLVEVGRSARLTDEDAALLDQVRDRRPAAAVDFG